MHLARVQWVREEPDNVQLGRALSAAEDLGFYAKCIYRSCENVKPLEISIKISGRGQSRQYRFGSHWRIDCI